MIARFTLFAAGGLFFPLAPGHPWPLDGHPGHHSLQKEPPSRKKLPLSSYPEFALYNSGPTVAPHNRKLVADLTGNSGQLWAGGRGRLRR
jgi:hypothetical protein